MKTSGKKSGPDPRPVTCGHPDRKHCARGLCRACYAARHYRSDKALERHLRRQYGLSAGRFEDLLKAQGGVCAICKGPQINRRCRDQVKALPDRLTVDHCHKTGQVRGLLCALCNAALGGFRDSPELLLAAVQYLLATKPGAGKVP